MKRTGLALVLAAVALLASVSAAAGQALWTPPFRISIVWPHDRAGNPVPVQRAELVNVSVWPGGQVGCTTDAAAAGAGGIRLHVAKNNEPAEVFAPSRLGRLLIRTASGVGFPSLEFDDLPADLAHDPTAQYHFTTGAGNVWVHAADARTSLPAPVVPTGYGEPVPWAPFSPVKEEHLLDARIQVVWPHDERGNPAPVASATRVNMAVDLFVHGTRLSVPPAYRPEHLQLTVAEGNDPADGTSTAVGPERTTYTVDGRTFPRWVFNDVVVRPGRQYHFAVYPVSTGMKVFSPHSTIWTHAADPRTFSPDPRPPPACAP